MGEDFTPVDAGVVHQAMTEAQAQAAERRSGSSSEAALRQQAEQLKIVRDKILDRLAPEFHHHRAAYPHYSPPDPAIARTSAD
jgi:hypothetical protein